MSTQKPPAPFKPEAPRRVVDLPGAAPAAPVAQPLSPGSLPRRSFGETAGGASRESPRKLIVGREIQLAGEITSCDHLVVEGRIEARIRDCRTIEIADSGIFKGSAEIDQADLAGRFEGDLTVHGRLRLRGTGVVTGTIRYGELEVETGGRLIGTLEPLEAPHREPAEVIEAPFPTPAAATE
jgi:cytoskeletal protein CcmA (bactofilin family)